METNDAIKQACTLTSVSAKAAEKLVRGCEYAIADALADARAEGANEASADVGFGSLRMKYEDGVLKWRFKPSEALEKASIDAISRGKNALSDELGKALSAKLTEIYKDLL